VARGFLLWRISYTCRCPISFTIPAMAALRHYGHSALVELLSKAAVHSFITTLPLRLLAARSEL
jgi:hypothetical protein